MPPVCGTWVAASALSGGYKYNSTSGGHAPHDHHLSDLSRQSALHCGPALCRKDISTCTLFCTGALQDKDQAAARLCSLMAFASAKLPAVMQFRASCLGSSSSVLVPLAAGKHTYPQGNTSANCTEPCNTSCHQESPVPTCRSAHGAHTGQHGLAGEPACCCSPAGAGHGC